MAEDRKKLLLNLISDVKARLDGKVDSVAFPIPQFIVVGKQSVGKSRLIEALAGETFNFVSGTLGSRRPTVLEFRNVPGVNPSKWSVFDDKNQEWVRAPVTDVMKMVGASHESLGMNVSEVPTRVKVEGADCVDLGVVDLPGFRAYARDAKMQELTTKIDKLNAKFMNDENNVMICVEEAGDAAGFATLGKCKQVDPTYRRTILIRNKLDKYYNDLTAENINKWLVGYGDLPGTLTRFAMSLPHFPDGVTKDFAGERQRCSDRDCKEVAQRQASTKYSKTIGFQNFQVFITVKVQQLFADALSPILMRLNSMKDDHSQRLTVISKELENSDEANVLHFTRSAGIAFAQGFQFLMEGALSSKHRRITLDEELQDFHKHCESTGVLKPNERMVDKFPNLDDYITYLREVARVPGMDVQLNGGAQFRRLMIEVEIFTRFAGLGKQVETQDVIQARGSGLRSITWEDVIVDLMLNTAPGKMAEKARYVGERLKYFFVTQKESTVKFMLQIKGSAEEHLYSRLMYEQAQVIDRNNTTKNCIYKAFDDECEKHCAKFLQMWDDYMQSMFQSPLALLKSCTMPASSSGDFEEELAPTFASTKARIEKEMGSRDGLQSKLKQDIKQIPDDDVMAVKSVKMVNDIIEDVFSVIRCFVSDQMQLYSESFFLLPMLRRLEGCMGQLALTPDDKKKYVARKEVLDVEHVKSDGIVKDLEWCIDAIQKFKVTCGV